MLSASFIGEQMKFIVRFVVILVSYALEAEGVSEHGVEENVGT